jgi:hypothetical protein
MYDRSTREVHVIAAESDNNNQTRFTWSTIQTLHTSSISISGYHEDPTVRIQTGLYICWELIVHLLDVSCQLMRLARNNNLSFVEGLVIRRKLQSQRQDVC